MNDHTITPKQGRANNNDTTGVCGWIRAQRIVQGLTQKQLCDSAEIPRSALCRYERGDHHPSLGSLIRIAKALNYDLVLRGIVPEVQNSDHPYSCETNA